MNKAKQQQKRKNKRKKRQGTSRTALKDSATTVKQALAAVEQLNKLAGSVGSAIEAAPLIKAVHDEVVKLGPLIDAVIEDQEAMNEELETLKQCVYTLVHEMSDDKKSKMDMLERLVQHMPTSNEEPQLPPVRFIKEGGPNPDCR